MIVDALSVTLRALSFIALFQAIGIALFVGAFGRELGGTEAPIRRYGLIATLAALILVPAHYALEAGRMAGDLSGIADTSLQSLVMHSSSGAALALRVLGLLVLAIGLRLRSGTSRALNVFGAVAAVSAFALLGHTADHPSRALLMPLLLIHLIVVSFWFGALLPLFIVSRREAPEHAAEITERFSALAIWLVPLLFAAGLGLAVLIMRHLAALATPYGMLLIAKIIGFALLMVLATLNKWRLTPAMARGEGQAFEHLRYSLITEYMLICVILSITAALTTFFSPEG